MRFRGLLILLLACPALMLADFSYEQNTRITGGAMAGMMKMATVFAKKAGQPIVATEFVQGNRMARLGASAGSIIDLDKETITTINFEKKTYSVMTFEQMREMMREMTEKMKGNKDDSNVKFKVSAQETGRTAELAGHKTKEILVSVRVESNDAEHGQQGAMNINSYIWVAPDVPGYGEVRAFQKRMAEKLGYLPEGQMAQMRQAMQGMVEVSKEVAKLDGVPIRTITEIGGPSGDNAAPPPQASQPAEHNGNSGSGLEALARGLGGFGKKKDQPSDSDAQNSKPGVLLESTMDSSGFSSQPVDPSKFEVPAGFKEVKPDRRMR